MQTLSTPCSYGFSVFNPAQLVAWRVNLNEVNEIAAVARNNVVPPISMHYLGVGCCIQLLSLEHCLYHSYVCV